MYERETGKIKWEIQRTMDRIIYPGAKETTHIYRYIATPSAVTWTLLMSSSKLIELGSIVHVITPGTAASIDSALQNAAFLATNITASSSLVVLGERIQEKMKEKQLSTLLTVRRTGAASYNRYPELKDKFRSERFVGTLDFVGTSIFYKR